MLGRGVEGKWRITLPPCGSGCDVEGLLLAVPCSAAAVRGANRLLLLACVGLFHSRSQVTRRVSPPSSLTHTHSLSSRECRAKQRVWAPRSPRPEGWRSAAAEWTRGFGPNLRFALGGVVQLEKRLNYPRLPFSPHAFFHLSFLSASVVDTHSFSPTTQHHPFPFPAIPLPPP